MRIYLRTNPKDLRDRSIFEGDMECRIRLDGQETDIVFWTRCDDKGIQELTAKILNIELAKDIESGNLVASLFGVDEDPDYPDCPQGTESEYDAARAAALSDEPQDEDREEVEQVDEEEDSDPQEEGQADEAPIGEGEGAVTG